MSDPNRISLHSEEADNSRKHVYVLSHFANIIRKNILLVAPDVDAKGFITFLNGPSATSRRAMSVATSILPKTITKSVVADLGKYRVESKDNIGYSPQFEKIFRRNCYADDAADFFIKNLTSARCNNGIVFIIQPYLVFRYDMKHRNDWIDRCRFIWIGCALFRMPSLLPVIAAQVFLYSIKIFIEQKSLTRKEQMSILAELLHFLPGMARAARPPFGMGLSVWYREMARHRRIVLEAILDEARNTKDITLYNPPYSMMNFHSIDELVAFVEDELRVCDKQETKEKENKMKPRTKKNGFDEDSEVDDEDRELVQLGGFGGEEEEEEEEDEKEEEEEEDGIEEGSETFTHSYSIPTGPIPIESMSKKAKRVIEMMSEIEIGGSVRRDCIVVSPNGQNHRETDENSRKRCMESGEEKGTDDREMSPPKKYTGANEIMDDEFVAQELCEEREEVVEEEDNEQAFGMIFNVLPEVWEEVEVYGDWDPSNELSVLDMQEGFDTAQLLLMGDYEKMESTMNLSIPINEDGKKNINDDSLSSDSHSSSEIMEVYGELRGGMSTSHRSDDESRDWESQNDDWHPEDVGIAVIEVHSPPPHVTFAPRKEMRVEVNEGEKEDKKEDEEDIDCVRGE